MRLLSFSLFFSIVLLENCHAWTFEMETVADFSAEDGVVSLALDPEDQRPHIVYQIGNTMYIATRANGEWDSEVVGDGLRPSLTFDPEGRPQIAYQQVAEPGGVRLAVYNGATWDRTTVYPLRVFRHDSMVHPDTGELQVAFIDDTSESVYRARRENGEWAYEYLAQAIVNRTFTQIEIDPWVGANRAAVCWSDNNAPTILPPTLHYWVELDTGWHFQGTDGDRGLGFSVATDLAHGTIHLGFYTAYNESQPVDYPHILVNKPEIGQTIGAYGLFEPSEGLPYQDSAIGVHPFNQQNYLVMGDPLAVIRFYEELHPIPEDPPGFTEKYDFLGRGHGHLRIGGQPSAAFDPRRGLFRFAFIDEVAGGLYYVEEKLESRAGGWTVYE